MNPSASPTSARLPLVPPPRAETTGRSFRPHPAVRPGCAVCRGLSYGVHPSGPYAKAQLCDCVGTCPHCKDTGFARVTGRRARVPCSCQSVIHRLARFNQACIPARMASCDRASFRPVPGTLPFIGRVSRWIDDYNAAKRDQGLVFYGPVGRGKTHMLVALVQELIFDYGVTARFIEFSHLLSELKYGFDRGMGASTLLEPLIAVDVLAIDELGKGRNTDFEATIADELVSRRYNAGRTLLAATNYEPGPSSGRATPNLATPDDRLALVDRVGERIYSRLRETCAFVPVRGEDYRERIWSERNP